MIKSDCQLVGTLAKLHSFKGRFLLVADTMISDEIENWGSVFLEIEGLLVPFFIDQINLVSETSAIIGFEDISSSDKAKRFLGAYVYQLSSIAGDRAEQYSPKLLQGYKIFDQKAGAIGIVDEILDYKQNLLFRVLNGKQEILIPVHDEIIVKVNHKKKEIFIAAPEGLIDLYL